MKLKFNKVERFQRAISNKWHTKKSLPHWLDHYMDNHCCEHDNFCQKLRIEKRNKKACQKVISSISTGFSQSSFNSDRLHRRREEPLPCPGHVPSRTNVLGSVRPARQYLADSRFEKFPSKCKYSKFRHSNGLSNQFWWSSSTSRSDADPERRVDSDFYPNIPNHHIPFIQPLH